MPDYPERLASMQPFWGSWYLDAFIGEGSYGKVYRVKREEFGVVSYSALKWISLPQNQSELRAFENEGKDSASIREYYNSLVRSLQTEITLLNRLRGTSHIVSLEDYAFIERQEEIGWDVLIRMELLTPLPNRIRDGMTVRDVVQMGIHLCDALTLCARHGVLHRDIKPDNIFYSENGDYKLGDFGVARQMERTQTGMSRKGTPFYMAPEVYSEQASDATVDQYSLGLVMHRLLNAQQPPFTPIVDRILTHPEREAAFRARMKGDPVPPPVQGSMRLKQIITKACSFKAKKRYASPEAMRAALVECLNDKGLDEPLLLGTGGQVRSGRSSLSLSDVSLSPGGAKKPGIKGLIALISAALVVLVGIGVFLLLWEPPAPPPEPPATIAPTAEATVEMQTTPAAAATPTAAPTDVPTTAPTAAPTTAPTATPTKAPTLTPTIAPTAEPTLTPAFLMQPASEVIIFAEYSAGADSAVRSAAGLTDSEPITRAAVSMITELDLSDCGLDDISFLSWFDCLQHLRLAENALTDISPLAGLSSLVSLDLSYNSITDLTPLRQLTMLKNLYLLYGSVSDLSPLADLVELQELSIIESDVQDLSPLASLHNLEYLTLYGNHISDVSALAGLRSLKELRLANNLITDVSVLSQLSNLELLHLSDNPIHDFSPLSGLSKLQNIDFVLPQPTPAITPDPGAQVIALPNGKVVQAVRKAAGLSKDVPITFVDTAAIRSLALRSCGINDASFLSAFPNLESLDLSANAISDLTSLSNLASLQELMLSYNHITDMQPLASLTTLRHLDLSYNQISDTSPLQGLPSLLSLNIKNNNINDVSPLGQLVTLTSLNLNDNQINDISSLNKLTALEQLQLSNNSIKSIRSIFELPSLKTLIAYNNKIDSLAGIENMDKLANVELDNNQITDISPLAQLSSLNRLSLKGNHIEDIVPLVKLKSISALYLRGNPIKMISPLADLNIQSSTDFPYVWSGESPDKRNTRMSRLQVKKADAPLSVQITWQDTETQQMKYLVSCQVSGKNPIQPHRFDRWVIYPATEFGPLLPNTTYQIVVQEVTTGKKVEKTYRTPAAERFFSKEAGLLDATFFIKPQNDSGTAYTKSIRLRYLETLIDSLSSDELRQGYTSESNHGFEMHTMPMDGTISNELQQAERSITSTRVLLRLPNGAVYVMLDINEYSGLWGKSAAPAFWHIREHYGRIPTGTYRIEVYYNDKLAGEGTLRVQ